MAGPKLSEEELRNVAGQLADFINPNPRGFTEIEAFGAGSEPLALYESFPLVHLGMEDARAALKQGRDLATALLDLKQWHHQMRAGDRIQAFARSQPAEAGSTRMSVRLLERSDDAELIDRALKILDNDRQVNTDDYDPVILDSREYDVGAVLLLPEKQSHNSQSLAQVYRAAPGQQALLPGRRYDSKDFLARFVTMRPISGVNFETERDQSMP
jgi:hypothetical protein